MRLQRSRRGVSAAELVLAADSFLISPGSRQKDVAIARAEGEEAWTVIAGYHWFTDWGRDTMISLEGVDARHGASAGGPLDLRTFARHIRDGLIPNLFPEGADDGLYHTADASLWFFTLSTAMWRRPGIRKHLRCCCRICSILPTTISRNAFRYPRRSI